MKNNLQTEISKILEEELDIEDFHFYRGKDGVYIYDIKSTTKVVKALLTLIKKHEKEVIGEDENVKEAVKKNIPYPNALIYRNELRHWQRKRLAKLKDPSGPKKVEK